MDNEATRLGRIPTHHVVADSIPLAYFRAMKAVWEEGLAIRTEYDRKDRDGNYIDPPSREARVLIEVTDPYKQPRFPPVSFCEIGAYIAEIMGLKDHYVIPMEELIKGKDGELSAHEWPYTYHQRLFDHPAVDGSTVNQMQLAVDRMAKTPHSRRAMATTSVPNVDPFLKEDIPCLRELQLRCPRDEQGKQALNMNTMWRSRDLYKAWSDNVIGLTFLQSVLADEIEEKSGVATHVGSYADYSFSLHIYGQDFAAVGGDEEQGLCSFFNNFSEESVIERSMTSEDARDMLIIPQLEELLTESKIKEWRFGAESIALLEGLVDDFKTGKRLP
jgi:Thymidylate synthase